MEVPGESVNYWKFATIGILLVGATVGATLLVVGRDKNPSPPQTAQVSEPAPVEGNMHVPAGRPPMLEPQRNAQMAPPGRTSTGAPPPPPAYPPQAAHPPQMPPQAAYPPQPAYPPQSVMEACNRYANKQVNSKTEEVLKDAALGAAIGAAVGAAGGAIAGGGSGAGKGAAIGGVTGVAGGTLYGLNESKSRDAQYQAAYASCMRSKGF